jgi:hypothetical protein
MVRFGLAAFMLSHFCRCWLCLPDMVLPLGLIAPNDKALTEFKIVCVFIARALRLLQNGRGIDPARFSFSWPCASG